MRQRGRHQRLALGGVHPEDRRDSGGDCGNADGVRTLVVRGAPVDQIAARGIACRAPLHERTDGAGQILHAADARQRGDRARPAQRLQQPLRGERDERRDDLDQPLLEVAEQRTHGAVTAVQRRHLQARAPEIIHVALGHPAPTERVDGPGSQGVPGARKDLATVAGHVAGQRRPRGGRTVESESAHS
ncbi:MAG: hypothetical protein EXR64_06155 [Dehalococcoidia bacterium]|nr:hypothetical protein [Dehalococcoidia bacterium]